MGLDMYAFSINRKLAKKAVDLELSSEKKEIQYWRKHHDLHGWMENLYRQKGGKYDFNCTSVRLSLKDLKKLEDDIKEYRLPATTGFFFGNNPPDEDSNIQDLKFIQNAREEIKNGNAVYYSSWW